MANEWVLNSVTNRFQLNYKRSVGAVAAEIRECSPKTVEEWRAYYLKNVRDEKYLRTLGEKLYREITGVIAAEVEGISEQECIDYIFNLVINRTFDGYQTEIKTIYGQLEKLLDRKIEPAPDEWDRGYNVDFFIKVKSQYIGLQVKPVSDTAQITQIYQERSIQKQTHDEFKSRFGGQVFYVFSMKTNGTKEIANKEVVDQIQTEIKRLEAL